MARTRCPVLLVLLPLVLLLVGLPDQARSVDLNVDRLASQQSDLVRQTMSVIEDAIEAQQRVFQGRIDALEGRVAELERIIEQGLHLKQPEPQRPTEPPIRPRPEPEQRPEPEPEPESRPEPEPQPAITAPAPTARRTTTRKTPPPTTTTTTTRPALPPTTTTTPPPPPAAQSDPQTCQEVYDGGSTTNGRYTIDPRGIGQPFEVTCNFDESQAQTIINHDSETEIKNNGNKLPGSFELVPMYDVETDQLAALVEASASCQQFIKIRCKAAVLFEKKGDNYGWWISREGDTMRSWGGVPSSTNGRDCACSVAGNCAGGKSCNCDAGARSEKSDEGLLTDKEYLPVQAVYLGDTGGRKQTSWLTLGPLVCFGNS